MARYDKYDPKDGGFRAKLAANWLSTPGTPATHDVGKVWAVGLDANGRVVKGAGNTGILGVCIVNQAMGAGEVVDVMTDGEIVEFALQNGTATTAGTRYYGVTADGTYNTTATGTPLGFTVEGTRLVVRIDRAGVPT